MDNDEWDALVFQVAKLWRVNPETEPSSSTLYSWRERFGDEDVRRVYESVRRVYRERRDELTLGIPAASEIEPVLREVRKIYPDTFRLRNVDEPPMTPTQRRHWALRIRTLSQEIPYDPRLMEEAETIAAKMEDNAERQERGEPVIPVAYAGLVAALTAAK